MWDIEVDLVSVGACSGGLAGAIATADAGGRVLVADPAPRRGHDTSGLTTRRRVHSRLGWLHDGMDTETDRFLVSLAEGLPRPVRLSRDVPVPTRVAIPTASADERVVEPFLGARLMEWAGQCLTSPYGMLNSSVFGWDGAHMRTADGEAIEVVSLGAIDWHHGLGEQALRDWMIDRAREREVEMLTGAVMERLVFEDGRVVGVVLSTGDGPLAVRARRGVTVGPLEHDSSTLGAALAGGEQRQVCLVGRTASRFGRVELLGSAAVEAANRPASKQMCPGPATASAFLLGLHEPRRSSSALRRYGKVHRHPAAGQ
jgi:hypothetical protein